MKLDPIAYVLLVGVLGVQIYATFLRAGASKEALAANEEVYQKAVFEDPDNKGVMHQIFRQNELNRELIKYVVARCP